MALIKCSKCNHMISTYNKGCPYCEINEVKLDEETMNSALTGLGLRDSRGRKEPSTLNIKPPAPKRSVQMKAPTPPEAPKSPTKLNSSTRKDKKMSKELTNFQALLKFIEDNAFGAILIFVIFGSSIAGIFKSCISAVKEQPVVESPAVEQPAPKKTSKNTNTTKNTSSDSEFGNANEF